MGWIWAEPLSDLSDLSDLSALSDASDQTPRWSGGQINLCICS